VIDVELELRAIALAVPAVASLLGDRVYPVILPQAATFPAATYQRIGSGSRVGSHHGDTGLVVGRVQFDFWDRTYLGAKTAAAAVRRALQDANRQLAKGAVPAGGTGVVRKIGVTLDRDDYDDEDTVKLYRPAFDVLTWFKED
jgi:hypothetical protein